MKKIIAFDCDSTLSAIEGVDELARLAGSEIFDQVENLTNQAMNGEVPVEEVFGRRLDLIKPTRAQCEQVGQMYLDQIEPTAIDTIKTLHDEGWQCLIISGGFAPCIEALAEELSIKRVEAVPLHFDENGDYIGYQTDYPTTRDGGKPEIIEQIKQELSPDHLIMVGDGVSDLETTPHVQDFVAFLRYVSRGKVVENSIHHAEAISDVLDIAARV